MIKITAESGEKFYIAHSSLLPDDETFRDGFLLGELLRRAIVALAIHPDSYDLDESVLKEIRELAMSRPMMSWTVETV